MKLLISSIIVLVYFYLFSKEIIIKGGGEKRKTWQERFEEFKQIVEYKKDNQFEKKSL